MDGRSLPTVTHVLSGPQRAFVAASRSAAMSTGPLRRSVPVLDEQGSRRKLGGEVRLLDERHAEGADGLLA